MSERDKESERHIRELTDALPVVVMKQTKLVRQLKSLKPSTTTNRHFLSLLLKKQNLRELYNPQQKLYNLTAQNASKIACRNLNRLLKNSSQLFFLNESDRLHENRKSKADGEIRTRVVASTGPLPLLAVQMCHKASLDLSC